MKKADFGKIISLAIMILGGVALAASDKKKKKQKKSHFFLKFLFLFLVVLMLIVFVYMALITNNNDEGYLYGKLADERNDTHREQPFDFSLSIFDQKYFEIPSTGMDQDLQHVSRPYSSPSASAQAAPDPIVNEPVANLPFWWECDECGNCRDSFGNEWYDVTRPFDDNRCSY